jgi:hypothetical protein
MSAFLISDLLISMRYAQELIPQIGDALMV